MCGFVGIFDLKGENGHEMRQKLLEMSAENASLRQQLEVYTNLEALTSALRPELSALFPQVVSIGLARMTESTADTTAVQHYVAALIDTEGGSRLTPADLQRLREWLKVRIQADSLVVIETVK